MKKCELEEQVKELNKKLATTLESLNLLKAEHESLLKKQESIINDAMYEKFKNEHGAYLDRYMREWLSKHVKVELNGDESNYMDVILKIDDETISTDTSQFSVTRTCFY